MAQTDTRVFSAKFIGKTEVANETFELRFALERVFLCEPGQYVWLCLTDMKYPDARGDRRAFSVVSVHENGNEITILLRKSESGFKKTALELQEGDEATVIGPFGSSFCFPENPDTPLVLVAGGVGIAPFLSLVRYAAAKKHERPITLVYADNPDTHLTYHDEIVALTQTLPAFRFIHVTEILRKEDFADVRCSGSLVYVSGTQGFVDHVHAILSKSGVFAHQFRFEHYYPTIASTNAVREMFDGIFGGTSKEPQRTKKRKDILIDAIHNSSNHVIITDINGVVVFCNKAAEAMTGYTFAEMEGQTPRLWGGLMSAAFYKELWEKGLNGESTNAEITNRKKNGALYHVIAHVSPIKNDAGEVIGFIGTEEDITHIKEAEAHARQSEERFRQLTEKIPEIYWIHELSPVRRAVYVSPAFENIFGVSREEFYRNPSIWADRIHHEDRKRVVEMFNAFVRGEASYSIEYRILDGKENTRWIKDQGELVWGSDGALVRAVGVARDITQEKLVDRAKTEFVSLASHQLKTPIGAIRWDAEMLLNGDYGKLSKKQQDVIGEIHQTDLRMKELVDGLLNISRIELGTLTIEPEPLRFSDVCDEVLQELSMLIHERRHAVVREYDDDMPEVPADPKLLRIIFQNLLSNAVKYTPAGGRIRVSIRAEGDEAVIRVFNNGIAIPEDEQGRIFTKLYRAPNAQEMDPDGTGLGLYVVKAIAQDAGGRIWLVAQQGADTEFGVAFPLSGMKRKEGTSSLV